MAVGTMNHSCWLGFSKWMLNDCSGSLCTVTELGSMQETCVHMGEDKMCKLCKCLAWYSDQEPDSCSPTSGSDGGPFC